MAKRKTKKRTKVLPPQVSLDDLKPDPKNARQRGKRAQAVLTESLKQFGAARSVVIDAEGIVRAGNGTLEAAIAAGIEKARVIQADGKELLVIQRSDMSGDQAEAYAIADNKTGELADWNFEQLAANLDGLTDDLRSAVGFEEYELTALLNADWTPPDVPPETESGRHALGFNDEQWAIVSEAIAKIQAQKEDGDMTASHAIQLICEEFTK